MRFEYKTVNVSLEPSPDSVRKANIETAANRWAQDGWRTVGVMPARGSGYADAILVERKIEKRPVAIQVDYEGSKLQFRWDDVSLIYVGER